MAAGTQTVSPTRASPQSRLRIALAGLLGVLAILTLIVFAYQLALARVPQHRAALERLVRSQTGLDVRFTELSLRWGWYGPEAVFRDVELDEPGSADAFLRAPELVVGFDAWRTLRSGHPEAGRIELVSPEIDFATARERGGVGSRTAAAVAIPAAAARPREIASPLDRVAVLQRWRGGRIDIDGGALRLPDPADEAHPFNIQIRRASLRRSDDEWNATGLVFLPDRVGRSARVSLRIKGDLGKPAELKGVLKLQARRVQFAGLRELLARADSLAPGIPSAGNGELTADLSFANGQISKVSGTLAASALAYDLQSPHLLILNQVRGNWSALRVPAGWRIRLDAPDPVNGQLGGLQINAAIRGMMLDWSPARAAGDRLRAAGRLESVALAPRTRGFSLSGLQVGVDGNESRLLFDVRSRSARLDLRDAEQPPLTGVNVAAAVQVSSGTAGWQVSADQLVLEHERATLSFSGTLTASAADPDPTVAGSGRLSGADVPLVLHVLGADMAQELGAVASRLTSGRIQHAEFSLLGPVSRLPFEDGEEGFAGSLTLRSASVSGGDLWPDARGIDARVEWHGARMQTTIESGRAGSFQLVSARAQWDAAGRGPTRVTGHITGRLEDALAWVREHPPLQGQLPDMSSIDARGEAALDFNVSIPARTDTGSGQSGERAQPVSARVATFVEGASVAAIAGLPPLEQVSGSFVLDSGHVQRSFLSGSWLGGPVTLRVGERRDKASRVLSVQAQGTLKSERLAALANATGAVDGPTDWSGELTYQLPLDNTGSLPVPRWSMRADSNLLGVSSSLPQPFAKRPMALVPVHLEVSGGGDVAQMRGSLGERLRGLFALTRRPDTGWAVERGAVRFGGAAATLPAEAVMLVRGRVSQLDLPAYALAWQRLRKDALPPIRAQMVADEMLIGSRSHQEVALRANYTDAGSDLWIDSAGIAGVARWPLPRPTTRAVSAEELQPAEVHLTRLDLHDGDFSSAGAGMAAAFFPAAQVSIDELNWRGRPLGRVTANVAVQDNLLVVDDLRLANGTHQGHGALRCQTAMPKCRLSFVLDSADAAATLGDFGFTADLMARSASLNGDVEWHPVEDQPWLANASGTVSLRLTDGSLRVGDGIVRDGTLSGGTVREGARTTSDAGISDDATEPANGPAASQVRSFVLFAVPALVKGLNAPGAAGAPLTRERHDLRFVRLDADYDLQDGVATTSNLHFDGDAEILMHGRIGLVARDYDQQVWVLRGEERLPAAVRRFGASPRVAAAWLSLRELFSGSDAQDRSRAALRLQGTWDDPMVVAEN